MLKVRAVNAALFEAFLPMVELQQVFEEVFMA